MKFAFIVLFIAILPIIHVYAKSGFFTTLDGQIHVTRIQQFNKSFKAGKVPVRLAPDLLQGAGYPLFVMNYTIPYYVAEPFVFLGVTPVNVFRLLMIVSFILYVFFSYVFFKTISNKFSSFIAAIYLAYCPYNFANLFMRGAFAEVMAITLIPLCFLFASGQTLAPITLLLGVLISIHTPLAVLIIPVIFLYIFLNSKDKQKAIIKILKIAAGAFLIGAFTLIPVIFERKYFSFDQNTFNIWQNHLLEPLSLFGSQIINRNPSPFQVGLSAMLVLLIATWWAIKSRKTKNRNLMVFFITVAITSMFMTTTYAAFLWGKLILLQPILFPWRLLTLASFSIAGLIALLGSTTKTRFKFVLSIIVIISILYSTHFLKPAPFSDEFKNQNENQFQTATTEGEFNPKNIDSSLGKQKIQEINFLAGQGEIKSFKKEVGYTEILINAPVNSLVQINTLYFPGWYLTIDGESGSILTDISVNDSKKGLITFWLAPGLHDVKLDFRETPVRFVGDLLTIISSAFVVSVILRRTSRPLSQK